MRNTRSANFSAKHAEVINRHSNQYFISEYYPINFVASDYYIFFDTLLSKPYGTTGSNLAEKASTWLYGPMRNPTSDFRGKMNKKYNEALTFLQSAAEIEYIRESTFLEKYAGKNRELKQLIDECKDAGPDKYLNLINAVNIVLKDKKVYELELNKEIERIQDRKQMLSIDRKALSEKRFDEKGNLQLTSEEWAKRREYNGDDNFGDTAVNPYYNFDGNKIFRSMFTKKSDFSIIAERVILAYGAQLLSNKGGKLQLDKRQSVAMMKILIQEAYAQLAILYGGVQKQKKETSSARKKRINDALDKMIEKNGTLDKFFNEFLNSVNPADTLTSIAEQNKIPVDEQQLDKLGHSTKVLNERIKKIWQQERDQKKTKDSYTTWRKKNQLTEKEIKEYVRLMSKISVSTYYTSESMAATGLVQKGFYTLLGNSANAPTDVNAGKIICQFSYEDNPEGYLMVQRAQQKMDEAQKKMIKQQTKITDVNSYKKNLEALQEMIDEQEKILLDLKQDLENLGIDANEMITHINIHETVKGYASIDATTAKFSGASFGTLITDQVSIINEMLSSGGITPLDGEWLVFALINCGEGDIGSNNKHALEDYLSGYVGLLMFSDATFIAQDIKKYMNSSIATDISNIHLYMLNNKYVPSSYILHETYKAMFYFYEGIDYIDQGTSLSLKTYNSPNSQALWTKESEQTKKPWTIEGLSSGEAWNKESQEALSKTHLDMYFLGNFVGLLRDLASQLSSI